MSSPAKQPAKKGGGGGGGGWGSLFSNTINNLESRLDTILAEDNEASARERAADDARKTANTNSLQRTNSGRLAPPKKDAAGRSGSREPSRTRANDRLAERLAKATASKTPSQAGSAVPSRVGTPVIEESTRLSGEEKRNTDLARSVPDIERTEEGKQEDTATEEDGELVDDSTLLQSGLTINPARVSMESSRPSAEFTPDDASSRPSIELANGLATKGNAELEADIMKLRDEHATAEKQRQEEMHIYMEKIDALQAKLQYLAQETVAAAKEANASTSAGSEEKKLAEKDEQIALLMGEGEKLSKTELKHLQTIKKLRSGKNEDEKATTELKRRLDKVERSEGDLKARLRRAEMVERQANEKAKQIANIEKQVEELRVDRENAAELVRSLTSQLKEARQKAEKAEKAAASKASEIDKGKIAALENEVEDAKIEKKLAEDRASSESKKLHEQAEAEKQRTSVRELELKNEIASLDSRLEAMRARVEEGYDGGGGSEGSTVTLMRQVETLQSQYSLAKQNWEVIESSLTSRVAELERENSEAVRREGEVRRKARDAGARGRRADEEVDGLRERVGELEGELKVRAEAARGLREKLEAAEGCVSDVRAEMERQRRVWEVEVQQKVEEERAKWQRQHGNKMGRNDSPPAFAQSRKFSSAEVSALHSTRKGNKDRLPSHELSALHTDFRPSSRRSSNYPTSGVARPAERSPAPAPPQRQASFGLDTPAGGDIPPTPSLSIADVPDFDDHTPAASPDGQRTLNDLLSTSGAPTASATGPSIQLIERLSTTIRRLESEKSTYRDELARLSSQRDAAREEVVSLMREAGEERAKGVEVVRGELGAELEEVRGRYEVTLEMLGEREEEVGELRGDVGELKRLYRELVEEKMGGG